MSVGGLFGGPIIEKLGARHATQAVGGIPVITCAFCYLIGPRVVPMVISFGIMTPFLGRTHFCTTTFGIFRSGNLYSIHSSGNQHYQKIIHLSNFFHQKRSKLAIEGR